MRTRGSTSSSTAAKRTMTGEWGSAQLPRHLTLFWMHADRFLIPPPTHTRTLPLNRGEGCSEGDHYTAAALAAGLEEGEYAEGEYTEADLAQAELAAAELAAAGLGDGVVDPADIPLCASYARAGACPAGDDCVLIHGDLCEVRGRGQACVGGWSLARGMLLHVQEHGRAGCRHCVHTCSYQHYQHGVVLLASSQACGQHMLHPYNEMAAEAHRAECAEAEEGRAKLERDRRIECGICLERCDLRRSGASLSCARCCEPRRIAHALPKASSRQQRLTSSVSPVESTSLAVSGCWRSRSCRSGALASWRATTPSASCASATGAPLRTSTWTRWVSAGPCCSCAGFLERV